MLYLIHTIQRCNPIPLSKSWVVEHLIDEVIDPRIKAHGHLTDVDQFRSSSSYNMHAQNLQSLRMK